MSGSRVKKQRRESGVRFAKAPKAGTPFEERQEYAGLVLGAHGTKDQGKMVPRSDASKARMLKKRRGAAA